MGDAFEAFWARYPRRVGKLAAERAYAVARKRASHEEIMAGLERYPFAAEIQFVPHPRTWLHQGRWMDEHGASPNGNGAAAPDETWWDECKRLHGRRCNGQAGHRTQMKLDALKEMR